MSTKREYNEWTETRWMDDTAATKRVLLIGDSIVRGHGVKLHETIKDKCCVDYFATSKIVSDIDYWSELNFMLSKKKYDMIIFNNGLHGFPVDDEEYAAALKTVVEKLKKYSPVLFWRNCTPCFTLDPDKPNVWEKRVILRNEAAEKIMKDAGVPILDVFSLLKDKKEFSLDGVHFNSEGYQILVDVEAELIRNTLA